MTRMAAYQQNFQSYLNNSQNSMRFLILLVLLAVVDALNFWGSSDDSQATVASSVPRRHDYKMSFKKPFYYNKTVPYFDVTGSVVQSMNFIRLVPSIPNLMGAIWSSIPNPYPEWETEIAFRVHSGYPEFNNVGGEGLAFWYTQERMQLGPILGSRDNWNGLGILIHSSDPRRNRNESVIMAFNNNGSINLHSVHDPLSITLGSCFKDYRNNENNVWLRISYSGNILKVELKLNSEKYETCMERAGLNLPIGYYFGISASTLNLLGGSVKAHADSHDIIAFEMYKLNPLQREHNPVRPHEAERIKKGQAYSGMSSDEYKKFREIEDRIEKMHRNAEAEEESYGEHPRRGHSQPEHSQSEHSQSEHSQPIPKQETVDSTTQKLIMQYLDELHAKISISSSPSSTPDNERIAAINNGVSELSRKVENLLEILGQLSRSFDGTKQDFAAFANSVRQLAAIELDIKQLGNKIDDTYSRLSAHHKATQAKLDQTIKLLGDYSSQSQYHSFLMYTFGGVLVQLGLAALLYFGGGKFGGGKTENKKYV